MTTPLSRPQLNLTQRGQTVLDGSGNGTVQLSPDGPQEHWYLTLASVKVAQPVTNEAQCRIYAGPSTDDLYFVDGTLSGSTGDSTDRVTGIEISRTQVPYIWAVWSGGDPGQTASLAVNGQKEIR
jgi:hypothetical protein